MPARKRSSIGQVLPKAKKMKQQRRQETPEKRNRRLEKLRERAAIARASETVQQREARLQDMKERAATSRALVQQREARLRHMKEKAATSKASEIVQQHEARLLEMYPGTCHVNCQALQAQDFEINIKMEKQEEPNLSASLEETCSCNLFSLPSIKEDNFLWNMEKQEKFWKFQKLEELPATFPELGRDSFSESMIKKENVCALDDDDAVNGGNPDLVKSEQKVNSVNWETGFENETVIKKENDCVGRNSKTSSRLSEELMKYPCNRNVHEQKHVAEKPYKCDFCGRAFSDSNILKSHRRLHAGEKSYKCDECNAEFSWKSSFCLHKLKHREKPYKCDFCGQAFIESRQLKSHKINHTVEKQYKSNVEFNHKSFEIVYKYL